MAYTSGTATNYLDLMDKLRRYAGGFGTAGSATPGSNTGNGTVTSIDTTAETVTETWTLTCTNDTGSGNETFSVTGSVSGAQASATVGVAYSNSKISFTINDGSNDFVNGDSFTIATTIGAVAAAGDAWEVMRWTGSNELILKGPGLSGDEEIFVGFKGEFSTPSDYYNWDCRGYTGYASGMLFDAQPGVSTAKYLSLWNSSIPYWFVVNGNRIIVVAKVSTTYQLGYFGYLLPYGQPSAFPYPLIIGASTGTQATRWSATGQTHSNITNACSASAASNVETGSTMHDVSGAWIQMSRALNSGFRNVLWPWNYQYDSSLLDDIDINPDSSYSLLPGILMQQYPAANVLGEMDGLFWTTGQSIASEDTITVDGDTYLAVQNIHRTGRADYCAVKLA